MMRKPGIIISMLAAAAGMAAGQPAEGDPPSRVARLNYIQGPVSFRPGSVDEWTTATVNYPLYNGDHLWADAGAQAELHIGSTAIRMGPETALAILDLDDRIVQLSLTGGILNVHLRALGDGETFEVDTPNSAVTLLRAGDYRFQVDENNLTLIAVRDGDAEVTGSGRAFPVRARESARITGIDDTLAGEMIGLPPFDGFDSWCQDRDRREDQSQSVRYTGRETIGYEDLDNNGVWSEVPDYGWVWAPRVSPGWAPYREGHWAWVEPWGWTWIDDEPWGFAPFHYGRWAMVRGGWVWVPGAVVARPVYAPALVAFVGAGNFSVAFAGGPGVAWFPLGPHEVYRPAYRVSEVYVHRVNVTQVNVTNINVTNVRYVNQNVAGAVTAVPRAAFVGARPVRQSAVAVPAGAMAQAQVIGTAAPVAPERASVLGRAAPAGRVAAPPERMAGRAVVARRSPPPPPVSFAAKRDALQQNAGRPLDRSVTESLRPNDRTRAPMVRGAAPSQPSRNDRPAARETAPPPARSDRPVTRQEQPRGEPRQEVRPESKEDRKPDQKKAARKEQKKEEKKQ